MDNTQQLLKAICENIEYLARDLQKCNDQIRQNGGEIKSGEVHYLKTLHKCITQAVTAKAMLENQEPGEEGYSNRYSYAHSMGSSYGEGGDGSSYVRGRMNAPRDSMGRYSGDKGESYAEGMSHNYLDGGLSEIINIARGKMVGLPPEEKRKRVQMITEELSR